MISMTSIVRRSDGNGILLRSSLAVSGRGPWVLGRGSGPESGGGRPFVGRVLVQPKYQHVLVSEGSRTERMWFRQIQVEWVSHLVIQPLRTWTGFWGYRKFPFVLIELGRRELAVGTGCDTGFHQLELDKSLAVLFPLEFPLEPSLPYFE